MLLIDFILINFHDCHDNELYVSHKTARPAKTIIHASFGSQRHITFTELWSNKPLAGDEI